MREGDGEKGGGERGGGGGGGGNWEKERRRMVTFACLWMPSCLSLQSVGLLHLGGGTGERWRSGPGGWLSLPLCPGGLACENAGSGCVRAGGPVFSPFLPLAGSSSSQC